MPGDPVIFDDGGSTRLKKKLPFGVGQMDTLLNVQTNVPVEGRAGSTHDSDANPGDGSYGKIRVSFIDARGAAFDAFTKGFNNFEIVSGSQRITGVLFPADGTLKSLRITVHGPAENPPIIEIKQHDGQRRYVVANAPPITEIFVDGNSEYRAAAPPKGTGPVLYTSVFVE